MELPKVNARQHRGRRAPAPGGGQARQHNAHDESRLQQNCVAWFRLQYPQHAPMLFAVPNGGGRSRVEAAIMKAEGVTAGVADLILLEARGGFGSLCVEMKTCSRSSRQSPAQKEWQKHAEDNGNRYVVCRTFDDFRAVVTDYMRQPPSLHNRVVVTADEIRAGGHARMTATWDK